jgi:hypothetical protein
MGHLRISHIPLIREVSCLFKHTNVYIINRATHTLFNSLLTLKEPKDQFQTSGINKLTWGTCNSSYIGQTGKTTQNLFRRAPEIHGRYKSRNSLLCSFSQPMYLPLFRSKLHSGTSSISSDFFSTSFHLFSLTLYYNIRFAAQVHSMQTNNIVLTVDCCFDWCGWLRHWRSLQRCEEDLSPRCKMYRCEA